MENLLAGASQHDDVIEQSKYTLDTGAYPGTISMAYVYRTASGATMCAIQVAFDSGKEATFTDCIVSGNAKGNKNYYIDRNGSKQYMPGYINIRNIHGVATGEFDLAKAATDTRKVKPIHRKADENELEDVAALVDMIGKRMVFAVQEIRKNKQAKTDTGSYANLPEEQLINEVVGGACANIDTRCTYNEAVAGTEAKYLDSWTARNAGKLKDKYVAVSQASPFAGDTATASPAASTAPASPDIDL